MSKLISFRLICFTLSVLLANPKYSQGRDNIPEILVQRLQQVPEQYPVEEVYVRTSKDICETGEDLWFKGYVLLSQYLMPSAMSRTMYVQLLQMPEKKSVWEEKYTIENDFADGHTSKIFQYYKPTVQLLYNSILKMHEINFNIVLRNLSSGINNKMVFKAVDAKEYFQEVLTLYMLNVGEFFLLEFINQHTEREVFPLSSLQREFPRRIRSAYRHKRFTGIKTCKDRFCNYYQTQTLPVH